MKIKLTKEGPKEYFAEMIGEAGIHAVGTTAELALEYLLDIYEQAASLRKEVTEKKLFIDRKLPESPLFSTAFKSVILTI